MIPLPCYPFPLTDEQYVLLKAAKMSLESPVKVLPVEANPESPGRVLCFGTLPPFYPANGVAPIAPANLGRLESYVTALRFWFDQTDPHVYGSEHWLSVFMGCDVQYHHSEDETGRWFYE